MIITREKIETLIRQKAGPDALASEKMILFGVRDMENPLLDDFNDFIGFITCANGDIPGAFAYFPGTTDPGVWYTYHHMAPPHGAAHYENGYHKKLFALGPHYDQDAFRQVSDANIWRDDNNNMQKDSCDFEQKGSFGMNLHSAKGSAKIYDWSAGCQVLRNHSDLARIVATARAIEGAYATPGRRYDYLLVDKSEV